MAKIFRPPLPKPLGILPLHSPLYPPYFYLASNTHHSKFHHRHPPQTNHKPAHPKKSPQKPLHLLHKQRRSHPPPYRQRNPQNCPFPIRHPPQNLPPLAPHQAYRPSRLRKNFLPQRSQRPQRKNRKLFCAQRLRVLCDLCGEFFYLYFLLVLQIARIVLEQI